jgi:hypothetical protein
MWKDDVDSAWDLVKGTVKNMASFKRMFDRDGAVRDKSSLKYDGDSLRNCDGK